MSEERKPDAKIDVRFDIDIQGKDEYNNKSICLSLGEAVRLKKTLDTMLTVALIETYEGAEHE